jgi:uncharacterized protein YacL (UPF0231 family)
MQTFQPVINHMHIEFHTPHNAVREWLITHIRDQLIQLHQRDQEISRAEVYLSEQPAGETVDKLCEIQLTIYGDSIFVRRKAETFEQASRDALTELADKVEERIKRHNEPPDEITSTVQV